MAKPTDHMTESPDPVVGEIAVPDKASLGWSPAEHVVVHLGDQEMVMGFIAPITGSAEDASIIELAAVDVPVGSLFVDVDGSYPEAFDLNELLSETEIAPELSLIANRDEADSVQPPSLDDRQDADLPDIAQMSVDLAIPPLTIVVDDESGSETVAL